MQSWADDKTMQRVYDATLKAYVDKDRDLLFASGKPNQRNVAGAWFWRGYRGSHQDGWDRGLRHGLAYAWWRAGRDARIQDEGTSSSRRLVS